MDVKSYNIANPNELEKLKYLFAKFEDVVNDIKVLHHKINVQKEPNVNLGAKNLLNGGKVNAMLVSEVGSNNHKDYTNVTHHDGHNPPKEARLDLGENNFSNDNAMIESDVGSSEHSYASDANYCPESTLNLGAKNIGNPILAWKTELGIASSIVSIDGHIPPTESNKKATRNRNVDGHAPELDCVTLTEDNFANIYQAGHKPPNESNDKMDITRNSPVHQDGHKPLNESNKKATENRNVDGHAPELNCVTLSEDHLVNIYAGHKPPNESDDETDITRNSPVYSPVDGHKPPNESNDKLDSTRNSPVHDPVDRHKPPNESNDKMDSTRYSSVNGNDNGFCDTNVVDNSNFITIENQVMGVKLPTDSAYIGNGFEMILNNEEPNARLTNYAYYLLDGIDSHDMLDHSLDSCTRMEIGGPEMTEDYVEETHFQTEVETSDHSTLTVGMLDHSLDSCTVNEVGSTETGVESSDHVTFTVGTAEQSDSINEIVEVEKLQLSSKANAVPCHIKVLNGQPRQGCDNHKMYVPTSNQGRYAKKLCCIYCLKRYSKLVRHLATVHKNEVDVQKFQALPIGSKKRRAGIDAIRKVGQFEWNTNGDINGNELSTSRRPSEKLGRKATYFDTCANCFGSYSSNGLRYHWNNCSENKLPGERIVKQLSRMVEGRLHAEACQELHTVLSTAHEDEEILAVRFDWIVILFGNDLCLNLELLFQHQTVRTHIRNAGKLLVAARIFCPEINDFASLYHVKYCNAVVGAIRVIAGFDSKTKTFNSPGTASTLVTLVNNIGNLVTIEYMKLNDEDKEKTATRFLTVFQKDAKLKVNKMVYVTKAKSRRAGPGKTNNIPSSDDIGKLATYLDREREALFIEISQKYSDDAWKDLAKLTLMSILVFNRKRVGDTQNILVSEFHSREIITEHRDKSLLDEETKKLIKSRMIIRGKLWREVPVLLKHHFDDCLSLLLRYRKKAGVPDNNGFLFGMPSKSGKIRAISACALFRKYSKSCGAVDPSSLRGTNLRKHLASMCATMDLNDNEVTNVANFMGHSDKIHRDVYRHNPMQREVVQMSTLLEAAQGKHKDNDSVGQVGSSQPKAETKEKRMKRKCTTANGTNGKVGCSQAKRVKRESITANDGSSQPKAETKEKRMKRKCTTANGTNGKVGCSQAKRVKRESITANDTDGPNVKTKRKRQQMVKLRK